MAKPYLEGKAWAMRQRFEGRDIYLSGFKSAKAVETKMTSRIKALATRGHPKGLGPEKTTVAQALQDYGMERLRFMKGARQEANRINKYLRVAGLQVLTVKAIARGTAKPDGEPDTKGEAPGALFEVSLAPCPAKRVIPPGLTQHRKSLAQRTKSSDEQRRLVAGTTMDEVRGHHLQELVDALRDDKLSAASMQLERALLRRLFNYADRSWNWAEPAKNPALGLDMPLVDNNRTRVMSLDEQARLDAAFEGCRNALVGPVVTLLRETAMRSSEALERARWGDIDWDNCILQLPDAKAGKREVPLSPVAMDTLRELRGAQEPDPASPLVQITYESLKAAWDLVCKRAGISDLHLHDLRHTAATRMALKTGNIFLVKALTGHKTDSQVARYVNVKASDVVAVMHADTRMLASDVVDDGVAAVGCAAVPTTNVVQVNFSKRSAA